MLFSLLKHYLDTDTALKLYQSVYCFTTSISHGVKNYFPRLWGKGISNAIFMLNETKFHHLVHFGILSQIFSVKILQILSTQFMGIFYTNFKGIGVISSNVHLAYFANSGPFSLSFRPQNYSFFRIFKET